MAKQDFRFLGYRTSNDTTDGGVRKIAYDIAAGNGAGGSTNGGYAAEGQSQLHSSLSASITTCGDYARAWLFSANRYSTNNYNVGWYGMGFLGTRSLGARLDPASGSAWSASANFANSSGKRTTATAVSIRATVRLGADNTGSADSASFGTSIGVFTNATMPSQTTQYTDDSDGDDYAGTVINKTTAYGTQFQGYTLMLSSLKHYSWGNSDIDSDGDGTSVSDSNRGAQTVRLLFGSQQYATNGGSSAGAARSRFHKCQGTYQYNKWYRIRMDITPFPGTDKIEIYTAPATDTVGSETWTKVATQYRFAGTSHYLPRVNADRKGIGYCVSAWRDTNATAVDKNHDAFIDGLVVYSKIV
jgi:hypothetical protein